MKKAKRIQVLSKKEIRSLTCSPEPKGGAGHYRDPAGSGEYTIQTLLIHYLQGHVQFVVFGKPSSSSVPGRPHRSTHAMVPAHQRSQYTHELRPAWLITNLAGFNKPINQNVQASYLSVPAIGFPGTRLECRNRRKALFSGYVFTPNADGSSFLCDIHYLVGQSGHSRSAKSHPSLTPAV